MSTRKKPWRRNYKRELEAVTKPGSTMRWLVDDCVEMPNHALIELARDYGYWGHNLLDARLLLIICGVSVVPVEPT